MEEIKTTLASADNESTAAPYWLILDPEQNTDHSIYGLANQITGPFFSRKDAEDFLKATRYNFSKRAVVFCHSGHKSRKYYDLCAKIGKV